MLSGLKAGEKLIVAGIQKIGDGAPVQAGPAAPRRGAGRRGEGASRCFSDLFIRRPILATVCSLLIMLAGAIAIPTLPIARYPELAPPTVAVTAFYTGANAQAVESAVTTPLEQVDQRRRGHAVHDLVEHEHAASASINVTFEIGRDPDLAAVDVQNRVNQALGRMPAEVRTNGITVTKSSAGFLGAIGFYSDDNRYDSLFISNYVDLYVRDALQARARRRQRHHLRRAQVRDAAVARSRQAGRARPDAPATSSTRCASRTCRSPPAAIGDAPVGGRSDVSAQRPRRRAADRSRRSSRTSSSRPARTARSCA